MARILANKVFELRGILVNGEIRRGWFTNLNDLAETACGLSKPDDVTEVYAGLYVTINEPDGFFGGLATGMMGTGKSTGKHDIARIRILPLDIDWNKPDGFKQPATDEEHAAVLIIAYHAKQLAVSMGWPEPLIVDSGNGVYVFFRVDLENTPENERLMARILKAFAAMLNDEHGHVDTGVFEPNRIFRLAGTINRKGPSTAERPHRVAKIIAAPADDKLIPVSREQLEEFVGPDTQPVAPEEKVVPSDDHAKKVQLGIDFLTRGGIIVLEVREKNGYTAINFKCPFKSADNTSGGAGLIIGDSIGFSCFHEKCKDKAIADVEKVLKVKLVDVAKDHATTELFGSTKRVFNDPHLLAEKHLAKWKAPDGHTLVCFGPTTFRYNHEGWHPVRPAELDPWIREYGKRFSKFSTSMQRSSAS